MFLEKQSVARKSSNIQKDAKLRNGLRYKRFYTAVNVLLLAHIVPYFITCKNTSSGKAASAKSNEFLIKFRHLYTTKIFPEEYFPCSKFSPTQNFTQKKDLFEEKSLQRLRNLCQNIFLHFTVCFFATSFSFYGVKFSMLCACIKIKPFFA